MQFDQLDRNDNDNDKAISEPRTGTVSRRTFIGGAAAASLAIPSLLAASAQATPPALQSSGQSAGGRPAAGLPIDAAVIASYIAQIRHGDSPTRLAAVKQAELVGTGAIARLGEVYGGEDHGASRAASEALKRIVYNAGRPGAPTEARAASAHLLELTAPGRPRKVRADAVMLLGVVGGPEEALALAELLKDEDIREDARMAMERIPGKQVDDILRQSSRTVPADYRSAIDLSLRHRSMKMKDLGAKR